MRALVLLDFGADRTRTYCVWILEGPTSFLLGVSLLFPDDGCNTVNCRQTEYVRQCSPLLVKEPRVSLIRAIVQSEGPVARRGPIVSCTREGRNVCFG